jgi:hypothetical protein
LAELASVSDPRLVVDQINRAFRSRRGTRPSIFGDFDRLRPR